MTHVRRHFKSNHPQNIRLCRNQSEIQCKCWGRMGSMSTGGEQKRLNETLATLNVEDESMEDRLGLLNINVHILSLS